MARLQLLLLCACTIAAVAAAGGRDLLESGTGTAACDVAQTYCDSLQNACSAGLKPTLQCDPVKGPLCICKDPGLAGCFPGSARVAVAGAAPGTTTWRRLADLQLGDAVLAVGSDAATGDAALRLSPVYLFSSRRPAQLARFLRVRTDAGLNVTVTPGHYMFAWQGAGAGEAAAAALLTPAAWPYVLPTSLKAGDVVPVVPPGAAEAAIAAAGSQRQHQQQRPVLARVTAVEEVVEQGVFMPHTLAGALVVDGVVASELTSFVPVALAGPAFQRGLTRVLRAAVAVLPPRAVEAAVRGVAAWAHGTADAVLSAEVLLGATAAASAA